MSGDHGEAVAALRDGFSRFLGSRPERLHVAAHSHHPWPDVTFAAQQQAWLDAAEHHDHKWNHVFGSVLPEFQGHVARHLALPDPSTIALGPNTHDLVMRLLSALLLPAPASPVKVLTTDAEFHSFARQIARLEEERLVEVQRVPSQPFADLPERLAAAATRGGHALVFVSQVLFDSGYVVEDLDAVVDAVPDDETLVVIDGYHGYLAVPTDLSRIAGRAFYLGGGYKYAMAGEGTGFLHCPPGYVPRPPDTGWYAGFGALSEAARDRVAYGEDGSRFLGATFDPSGLYRANAVHRWLADQGLGVADLHAHVRDLQRGFVARAAGEPAREAFVASLVPEDVATDRGHFLTFVTPSAGELEEALAEEDVIVDHRRDRLRLGFGCYHHEADLDVLWERLDRVLARVAATSR